MKKLIAILLAAVLCFAAVSCTSKGDGNTTTAAESTSGTPADSSASVGDDSSAPADDTSAAGTDAAADNLYTYDHITVALPEGFTLNEDSGATLALCPDYPTRTDNIAFSKGGADNIGNYTRELLDSIYSQTFAGFGESTVFEKTVIDGKDALKYGCTFTQNNVAMTLIQIMIFGSTYSDVLTFTSVSGYYDAAFEAVIASISVAD